MKPSRNESIILSHGGVFIAFTVAVYSVFTLLYFKAGSGRYSRYIGRNTYLEVPIPIKEKYRHIKYM